MHMSGPSRKEDENIFSDVYFIPITVVLVHSTAYVQAHILNFLPVISLPAPWVWEREKGCVCVRERVSVKEGEVYMWVCLKRVAESEGEILIWPEPWCSQLYGTYQITYKYSHHWAVVHFQGNAEKGPLVGSLQVFLEVFVFLVTTG